MRKSFMPLLMLVRKGELKWVKSGESRNWKNRGWQVVRIGGQPATPFVWEDAAALPLRFSAIASSYMANHCCGVRVRLICDGHANKALRCCSRIALWMASPVVCRVPLAQFGLGSEGPALRNALRCAESTAASTAAP